MYSPILRNRQNETLAIQDLSAGVRASILPLFDLAAATKSADRQKEVSYVEKNITRMQKSVSGIPLTLIDSSELSPEFVLPGNMHPMTVAISAIAAGGSEPIPVTGLHRDSAHNDAVRTAIAHGVVSKLCLRLDSTDVSTPTMTSRDLLRVLDQFSIDSGNTILMLDMQCLFGVQSEPVAVQITRLLGVLNSKKWFRIQIGGYGVPDQIANAVSTNAQGYISRVDQEVFYSVIKQSFNSQIGFADYTMVSPAVVELDWRLVSKVMTPRALYALPDNWFVVRGGAVSTHPDGYDQYFTLAKEIVALDEFSGAEFSAGDAYILERSQEVGKPGNAGSWIRACVNHHVTLTAQTHAAR